MYYEINETDARRAKEANSYSDYIDGSATAEYRRMVDVAARIAENQKRRVDSSHHQKIDCLLDSYARKLAENINRRNEIDARVPSILITGGSRFPVSAKNRQNAAREKNMEEYRQISEIVDRIRSTGTGGIMSDEKNAAEKLQKKLESLQADQERMRAINAYWRKNSSLDGCNLITAAQKSALEKDAVRWGSPIPAWSLRNNSANIRRVKDRIEKLRKESEKAAAAPAGEPQQTGDGWKLVENHDLMRIQFLFENKPTEDVRASLKSNGFRWAPSAGAWQRMLNDNGRHAARIVIKALTV